MAAGSDSAPRSRLGMMSATQSCRSRFRTTPIRVQDSHGEGNAPGSGKLCREGTRSPGSGSPARAKAARSALKRASIGGLGSVDHLVGEGHRYPINLADGGTREEKRALTGLD